MAEQNVVFPDHALQKMGQRGVSEYEVREAIQPGERTPAKKGRLSFGLNFDFDKSWGGKQ